MKKIQGYKARWSYEDALSYRGLLSDNWSYAGGAYRLTGTVKLLLQYAFGWAIEGNGSANSFAYWPYQGATIYEMTGGLIMDPSDPADFRYPFRFDLQSVSTGGDKFYSGPSESGWRVLTTLPTGNYSAKISYPTFLNRVASGNVPSAGYGTLSWDIVRGDVDMSQEIDADDLDLITEAFGLSEANAGFLEPLSNDLPALLADVDESGEVDSADTDVVIGNYGLTGDWVD